MNTYSGTNTYSETKAYLVGGGIASLASAVYLIRDGGIPGENIFLFEQSEVMGGSLDGAGSAEQPYIIRGGRMFTEEAYSCTFDLLSLIPSLSDPEKSVETEIREFNDQVRTHSQARLVRNGHPIDASKMGLSGRDRLDMIALLADSEEALGPKRIEDVFDRAFFGTNFWHLWCTTFAFQPWHSAVEMKRYLLRFIQEFPRLHTLAGVRRTRYNQYDSLVAPLTQWLTGRGVQFVPGAEVLSLDFKHGPQGKEVEGLCYQQHGTPKTIAVQSGDFVFVTNGSMTAASSLGSMTSSACQRAKGGRGTWPLWETLAAEHSEFGRPGAFSSNIAESKWLSFTVTQSDPLFFNLMEHFTGNEAGTGGLVTLLDSHWLMSVVLPYQPHFINQLDGVSVFWGYGLFPEEEGNFSNKRMADCTGSEIIEELCQHLRFDAQMPRIVETSTCIPCQMPFITSQFMPRVAGDRPLVRPTGTTNLAFIGQYCEMPDDVVFTVEYSVRSAQTAVFSLLGIPKEVSPLYQGQQDVGVLLRAMETMFH